MKRWAKRMVAATLLGVELLFLGGLHAKEHSGESSKLVLATPENDGILIQYATKVYEEAGKRAGREIEVTTLPKIRTLIDANGGHYDGLACRVAGLEKEYPNLRRVGVSPFSVQHLLFAKKSSLFNAVHDFETLFAHCVKHGCVVGYMGGSKKAIRELAPLARGSKLPLDSPEEAFEMLAHDRIDAYLAGPGLANRVIFNQKFFNSGIKEVGVFAQFPLYPYLHKKHTAFVPILEKALQSMIDDGRIKKIQNELESVQHQKGLTINDGLGTR